MSEFRTIAKVGAVPDGEGRAFTIDGLTLAVFRRQDEYFAIDDFCPHMGAPLSGGFVDVDGGVVCPWHAWKFSLKDGSWLDNPRSSLRVGCYEIRVDGENIQVKLPPNAACPPQP